MQFRVIFVFLFVALVLSCKKEDDGIIIEGLVRDSISKQPLSDISILIDGIKPPSGMGIISDGRRESVGHARTDANGYYKAYVKLFKEVKHLEFFVNGGQEKEWYTESGLDTDLTSFNRSGVNNLNFALNPTGLLKISFNNANPVSDTDFFYFGWLDGTTKGVVEENNCGTVIHSEALTWTGKDVCGAFTVETIAEKYITVYWTVTKDGITNQYSDSVFVRRQMVNDFSLDY